MKTIEKYVFGSFMASFVLAFLVLSFVLTVALMVKIVGYMLEGVSPALIGRFAFVSFPETLQWTVPLALLVSSVLVFSRLSADGEIAAMRACGVNLLSVVKYPALFAAACTALAAWVNNEIVPRGHEIRRNLKTRVSVGSALDILEPGGWIEDFPKVKIYVGRKEGAWLHDLIVLDYSNPRIERMIRASKALVSSEGRDVSLDLYDMTVDPLDEDNPLMAHAARFTYVVKDALKPSNYVKKAKDLGFGELVSAIRSSDAETERTLERLYVLKNPEIPPDEARRRYSSDSRARAAFAKYPEAAAIALDAARKKSRLKVELSKRFAFAAASLCFVLVGIPLGIRSQRRESTAGMALSLATALGYYLVAMLMLDMEKHYSLHPELLIWIPAAACFAVAARLYGRNL